MRGSRLNRGEKNKKQPPVKKDAKSPLFGILPLFAGDNINRRRKRASRGCFKARFLDKAAIFQFYKKTRNPPSTRDQGVHRQKKRPTLKFRSGISTRQAKRLYRPAIRPKCAKPARQSPDLPPRASARLRGASRRRGRNRSPLEF